MINIQSIIKMLIVAVVTIASITFHEFSHGYASYLLGDDTPKVYRRLTLNPLKHLDIVGAICLALFHFGWAKPVPINPYNYKNKKLGVVIVSLAGPIANLILAFIATFIWIVFIGQNYYLDFSMQTIIGLNLGLAVFNLIPIPPLDGSRILSVFLSQRARNKYNSIEKYGVIVMFIILLIPVFGSLLTAIIDLGVNGILKGYIFIITQIVGLF